MKTLRSSMLLLTAISAISLTGLPAVRAGQPKMEEALSALKSARAALEHAEANKGGHREKAIAKIDEAIDEVRAGMTDAGGH